jgi:hypothetical protein
MPADADGCEPATSEQRAKCHREGGCIHPHFCRTRDADAISASVLLDRVSQFGQGAFESAKVHRPEDEQWRLVRAAVLDEKAGAQGPLNPPKRDNLLATEAEGAAPKAEHVCGEPKLLGRSIHPREREWPCEVLRNLE